jgi:hypothetical protein
MRGVDEDDQTGPTSVTSDPVATSETTHETTHETTDEDVTDDRMGDGENDARDRARERADDVLAKRDAEAERRQPE